jgi:hypothetical protein
MSILQYGEGPGRRRDYGAGASFRPARNCSGRGHPTSESDLRSPSPTRARMQAPPLDGELQGRPGGSPRLLSAVPESAAAARVLVVRRLAGRLALAPAHEADQASEIRELKGQVQAAHKALWSRAAVSRTHPVSRWLRRVLLNVGGETARVAGQGGRADSGLARVAPRPPESHMRNLFTYRSARVQASRTHPCQLMRQKRR